MEYDNAQKHALRIASWRLNEKGDDELTKLKHHLHAMSTDLRPGLKVWVDQGYMALFLKEGSRKKHYKLTDEAHELAAQFEQEALNTL